jgi:acetyl esterase/lipase
MPIDLLRQTVASLARRVDRAFAETALRPSASVRSKSSAESLGVAARLRALELIGTFYAEPDPLTTHGRIFPSAPPIVPIVTRARGLGGEGEVLDLQWASEFEPLWSLDAVQERLDRMDPAARDLLTLSARPDAEALLREFGIDQSAGLREKYLRATANRAAHARWFRHAAGPRPVVVMLHGYLGGNFTIEERVMPVRRLFEGGLDVVLTVLPLHGMRRSQARGFRPPAFPSSDPRFTIEGFRQLVWDHRGLFEYLRAGGAPGLGVMGMSLGGFAAALLSTLERGLRFSVLFIPLAAIDQFAHDHGRMLGTTTEQQQQRDALRAAQWPISPLARPPLLAAERVAVVAGEADEVTGLTHAQTLAAHFGTQVSRFEGGHLLHFGRERAFEPVWQMLEHEGFRSVRPLSGRVPKSVRP